MECHDFDKAEIEHAIKGAPEDIAEWNEVNDILRKIGPTRIRVQKILT